MIVRHEGAARKRQSHAEQKMRAGPSESLCRRRLQTTLSCCGQKPWWRALRKRQSMTLSGECYGDEHKSMADKVSKA
jgi:hypothetical protein